jgi:Uma2 family endonuclease
MADNTLQFEWIVTLQGNIDLMFRDNANVFVAGDHLIYPVEGNADIRQAPDVYVAFGRPKGHRGSYKVFAEDGIFPQVVFEVWSPSNTAERMEEKRRFYERYGAEEYYILYPDFPAYFQGWCRESETLVRVANMNGFVSPRLGIRFEVGRGHVGVFWPNGRPFLSYLELGALQQQTEARAEQERLRAEQEKQRAERLAAKLREMGVDPDAV